MDKIFLYFLIFSCFWFVNISAQSPDLIPIRIGEKFGYVNSKFKNKIPPIFENAELFDEYGRAIVALLVKKETEYPIRYQAVIDTMGNLIIPPFYTTIKKIPYRGKYFYHAIKWPRYNAPVSIIVPNHYLLDFKGNEVIMGGSRNAISIYHDYVILKGGHNIQRGENGIGSGLLSFELDTILPRKFRNSIRKIDGFFEAYAHSKFGGGVHYFDTLGNNLFKPNYDRVAYLSEQKFVIEKNGKWAVFNPKGVKVSRRFKNKKLNYFRNINLRDKRMSSYKNGMMMVIKKGKNEKFGFLNEEGNLVVKPIYENAKPFHSSGFTTVKKNGNWGVIDQKGKTIIPFQYNYLNQLNGDAFLVKKGSIYGLINLLEQPILPINFWLIHPLKDNLGFITNRMGDQREELVDLKGKPLSKDYNEIEKFPHSKEPLIRVREGDFSGLIDQAGKEIIPPEYSNCQFCGDDIYMLKKDNEIFFAKSSGEIFFKDLFHVKKDNQNFSVESSGKIILENTTSFYFLKCKTENRFIKVYQELQSRADRTIYFVDYQGTKYFKSH